MVGQISDTPPDVLHHPSRRTLVPPHPIHMGLLSAKLLK